MTSDSGTPSHPAPPPSGSNKITPRDVAAATAVGAASKLGLRRRKGNAGEGASAGAGAASYVRGNRDRGQLMTALAVFVVMVGMLALMIVLGK